MGAIADLAQTRVKVLRYHVHMIDLAVIGGGASGLVCACAAAEVARAKGVELSTAIFESKDRVGRKILASGNGRCNFSNAGIDALLYNDAQFACLALSELDRRFKEIWGAISEPNSVVQYLVDHGLAYREEADGRLYPLANKSSSVLDVLRSCSHALGVRMETDSAVRLVVPPKDAGGNFTFHMADKALERSRFAVCAAGAAELEGMLPACIPYRKRVPVLCALKTAPGEVRKMSNIRVKCEVSLLRDVHGSHRANLVGKERGELMFRDFGVSGIAVFNLSRFARPGDAISIDFLPDVDESKLEDALYGRFGSLSRIYGERLTYGRYFCGLLLPLVSDVLLARLGLSEDDVFDPCLVGRISRILKSFKLDVEGSADAGHAQVMRGGFETSSFSPATLEAKKIPGLHVVGEALDVDGPCGGYNLHWAFATGILAGIHCAELARAARRG